MKSQMGGNFMAQFVSFVDIVNHQEEVASTASYPVLLVPLLPRLSMPTLVSLIKIDLRLMLISIISHDVLIYVAITDYRLKNWEEPIRLSKYYH